MRRLVERCQTHDQSMPVSSVCGVRPFGRIATARNSPLIGGEVAAKLLRVIIVAVETHAAPPEAADVRRLAINYMPMLANRFEHHRVSSSASQLPYRTYDNSAGHE